MCSSERSAGSNRVLTEKYVSAAPRLPDERRRLDRLRAFTHNGLLRRSGREVAQWFLRMFLEGESLRAITHRLNVEALVERPPPSSLSRAP